MNDVNKILGDIQEGKAQAASELLPLVYDELRRLAAHQMSQGGAGHTLQPTALVHEAWLRLGGKDEVTFENRRHFFAAAAQAMRHILVDRCRERLALKRGGKQERVDLEQVDLAVAASDETLLAVHEALETLAQHDSEAARFIQLRFFAGMTNDEAALVLGVPERTARRHWTFAKAWLYREMQRQAP